MKDPNGDQWSLFVQIADSGSLTEAATARDVAQPTLSRRLAAIERACGGHLSERGARGLRLNEAGQRLYVAWLAQSDALVADARGDKRRLSGVVCLEVLASFEPSLVGRVFRELRGRFPEITLQVVARTERTAQPVTPACKEVLLVVERTVQGLLRGRRLSGVHAAKSPLASRPAGFDRGCEATLR